MPPHQMSNASRAALEQAYCLLRKSGAPSYTTSSREFVQAQSRETGLKHEVWGAQCGMVQRGAS